MSRPCPPRVVALVEKLADGEATASERTEAEAHLAQCGACGAHLEFLTNLEETAKGVRLPEPTEGYWELLPRKILDRIASDRARPSGFWQKLLAPDVLRWEALAATLLVLVAVGMTVLWNDALAPPAASTPPAAPAPVGEPDRVPSPAREEASSPEPDRARPAEAREAPPMARDEREEFEGAKESPAEDTAASLQSVGDVAGASSAPPPAPALKSAEAVVEQLEQAPLEAVRRRDADVARERAAPRSVMAVRSNVTGECDRLRENIAQLGEEGRDGHYELARCSLGRFDDDPSDGLRELAVSDAEAFLALESEGPRAAEIRAALARIRPE